MRFNRTGVVCGVIYLLLGLAWLAVTNPGSPLLPAGWFVIVAVVGSFIPGLANQVSLARAYLAAPALAYTLVPGRLGLLAVVLAVAGLTDLVDGTIARRFDKPSTLGGGLDPVVDGVLLVDEFVPLRVDRREVAVHAREAARSLAARSGL